MTSSLIYQWLFLRLSRRFSLPFLAIAALYFVVALPRLIEAFVSWLQLRGPQLVPEVFWGPLGAPQLIESAVVLVLVVFGLVLSLWTATTIYRRVPPRPVSWHVSAEPPARPVGPPAAGPLGRYHRLGIILAGGGAKGAYQAGALAAIHDFLDRAGALGSVRMIAGTSIGAWNACFWLADRIGGGSPSLCQRWWSEVHLSEVVAPTYYLPGRRNFVLSAEPWRQAFRRLFVDDADARDRLRLHLDDPECAGNLSLYLTRTNVERAHLEFSTNRADLTDIENASGRRRPLVPGDRWAQARTVEDLEEAVFASMDLPPLFENIRIGDEVFEDGGVVDNLPIYFGTGIEKCDLLFVLPLNASFTEAAGGRSVLRRLQRVMTIRQGTLERKALKDVYLYNELAALRERLSGGAADAAEAEAIGSPSGSEEAFREAAGRTIEERARRRVHRPVQVFAVCPDEPLLLETVEFWKTEEAGRAYRLMHEYTRYELEKFDFEAAPNWIRVALVGPQGEVRYLEDF